jgi:class 3 adenylate cyclase
LHYGEVRTREREVDLRLMVVGGTAILCAARVEPVVEPGQIWATDEFREQFLQRPSLWRTTPLQTASGSDLFNVSKKGSTEPDLWLRLHRLES